MYILYLIIALIILIFINPISAIPKTISLMFTLLKYMIHISFILGKPLTIMVVVGLKMAVLTIALIFAGLFGLITLGSAVAPILSGNMTIQMNLDLFRQMVFTGIDTLDHYLFAIGPFIDKIFTTIISVTDQIFLITQGAKGKA